MKKIISLSLLLLAAIIWGFAFVAQKAAENVPPFTIGALRSIFAAIFLLFVIMFFDRIKGDGRRLFSREKPIDFNRFELVGGVICGIVLAAASFFQQAGINNGTSAGKASFITALYVVLVPVYALFLKKRAGLNIWISVASSVLGFYLLCINGEFGIAASDVLVICASLIFPIHILAIDRYSPICDGVRMSCIQFFTCAIVNTVFALIFELPLNTGAVIDAILPLVFLGVGSSGIAYTLQIVGQKGVNPSAASLILSMESVFGVIGSAIILSERMTEREYIGCAVVLGSVILSQLEFSPRKRVK